MWFNKKVNLSDVSEEAFAKEQRIELLERLGSGETFDALKLRWHFEGTHVKDFNATLPQLYPVVDEWGYITEFHDGEGHPYLVLADWIDGKVVIHPGACQMLVRRPEEEEQ